MVALGCQWLCWHWGSPPGRLCAPEWVGQPSKTTEVCILTLKTPSKHHLIPSKHYLDHLNHLNDLNDLKDEMVKITSKYLPGDVKICFSMTPTVGARYPNTKNIGMCSSEMLQRPPSCFNRRHLCSSEASSAWYAAPIKQVWYRSSNISTT